jgi:hypothetical protein
MWSTILSPKKVAAIARQMQWQTIEAAKAKDKWV